MAAQIQQIPVPFIQPMEPQHSPVAYEQVAEHQPIPVIDPITKEVITIVGANMPVISGRDFNQNAMSIVTEPLPPQIIPLEAIQFEQKVIEDHKIEAVSTQVEQGAVQIETSSITPEEVPVIANIPDGTMVHTTITKSMSWTNQHQQQHNTHHQTHHQHQHNYSNKKSTASVAVTAIPAPSSNGKTFSPSIKQHTASTTTSTPTPQVKNHGAMKTPSSPVGVQNNSSTKGTATTISSTTSTASATAIPQQLQETKKANKSQGGPLIFTPPITNPQPQNNNQQSWASLFVSSTATTNYTTSPSSPIVPPPSQNNTTNNSNNSSSSNNNNNPALPATIPLQTTTNSATITNQIPTKPVAKVAPYESGAVSQTSPVISQTQPQTNNSHTNSNFSTNPGALSYSAASSQSLSSVYSGGSTQTSTTPNNNNNYANNVKSKPQNAVGATMNNNRITTTNNSVNHKNQTSNVCGDEWSIKLARMLTKYKTDYNAVSLKPRGMMNKSNYCYINSILQALIGCPPFFNLLKNLPKQPAALQTEVKTPTLNAM